MLSGLGSRDMRSFFGLGFSMNTNEFTHSVGSFTFLITLSLPFHLESLYIFPLWQQVGFWEDSLLGSLRGQSECGMLSYNIPILETILGVA